MAPLPHGYDELRPRANYAPWSADTGFQKVYQKIQNHTLVDEYRCYTLYQLARQVRNSAGDVLEVGVWRGGTGALLAAAVDDAPPTTVYLADTFHGVVKAGPRDGYYRGGEHADTSREIVESLLCEFPDTRWQILSGIFPEETGETVADRRFCMVHIDVDVYQSARDILEWVWPRLTAGGVVVFDDYGFYGCEGVTALGNELLQAAAESEKDYNILYNLSGQAILTKIN